MILCEIPELSLVSSVVVDASRRFLSLVANRDRLENRKDDGSVVTRIDTAIQASIESSLKQRWPEIPFLGEEMTHYDQTAVIDKAEKCFWVLDPLDGTTNFVAGFPFYGISLGLVVDGCTQIGVVYDPVRGELFTAVSGRGAWLNGNAIKASGGENLNQCIANIDYKRLTGNFAERLVRSPPYRSQRNLGACVLEWCWLAAGRFQLYLHGGEKLWDYAAGSLILQESGGMARTFENHPVDCWGLGKKSVIAASTPELFERWRLWIFSQGCLPPASLSPGRLWEPVRE